MVTVALELADEAAEEQAKRRDPEVRDVLLRVLGTKTVDGLTDVTAREALKQELKDSAATVFRRKGAVRRLYLPQFVVQ
jgi:flagellar FliL protein